MRKLIFNSSEEFSNLFTEKHEDTTDVIAEAIQEAVQYQKNTANLFEIIFTSTEYVFEISLPKSQWKIALETCLKHYEELGAGDKALETYLLLKEVKEWTS